MNLQEKEVQTAWEIWTLLNRLNDLLFDRYEEEFSDLWAREGEQEDPFLHSLDAPDLPEGKIKKNTAP